MSFAQTEAFLTPSPTRLLARLSAAVLTTTRRRSWLIVILVLLITFAHAATGLDFDPLWYDEVWSVRVARVADADRLNFAAIWTTVATRDPNFPPLYFFLLKLWSLWVGSQAAALRSLSAFAGLLTIAWIYRLGRDFFSPRIGLYSAIVLGSSAFFIYYLHEIRMYVFVALFTVLTLWCYLRVVDGRRRPGFLAWLGLFGGALALAYVHYYAFFVLVALATYHLTVVPRSRRWWQITGLFLVVGLLFIPWIGVLVRQIGERISEPTTVGAILPTLATYLSNGHPWLLAAATLLIGLGSRRHVARLMFFALVILGCVIVATLIKPVIHAGSLRYLMPLWPLYALLVGVTLAALEHHLARRTSSRSLAGLTIGLAAVWLIVGARFSVSTDFYVMISYFSKQFPFHYAVRDIGSRLLPDDLLMLYLPDGFSRWIHDSRLDLYFAGYPIDKNIVAVTNDWPQADEFRRASERIDQGRLRLWLGTMPNRTTTTLPAFEALLANDGYQTCEQAQTRPNFAYQLLARAPICCSPPVTERATHQFGDEIRLLASDVPQTVDGGLAFASVWWTSPTVPPNTYSLSFQVLDDAQTKVAQADYGLPAFNYACLPTEIPLDNVPPGDYHLWAAVYDWRTQERLPALDRHNGMLSDLVEVGAFTVE